jgi:hypothetical protein
MHTCSLTKTVVTGRCCEPLHPDKDQLNISKILAAQAPRGPGSKPLFITTKVPTPTSARDPTANCTQAYAQAKVHMHGEYAVVSQCSTLGQSPASVLKPRT